DSSGDDATIVIVFGEFVDGLNWQSERPVAFWRRVFKIIERGQKRWALVPRHGFAAFGQIFTVDGADRNKFLGADGVDAPQKFAVFLFDLSKMIFLAINQIHFVDTHHDLFDPEHRKNIPVTPTILSHAFFGVDDKHGRFRASGTRYHVFQKLDVTRCI